MHCALSPFPTQADALLASDANAYAIQTEDFDGPLELLLFLVRQQGVDIRTVPIAPITDAYLAQISILEAMELDSAGEFLVIAATLCLIKSREMFPQSGLFDEEEEEDDPEALREALARRLLEYERYKEAGEALEERPRLGRDVFARPEPNVSAENRPVEVGVDAMGLLEVFYSILQNAATEPPIHAVERQAISMEEVASWMIRKIEKGPRELQDLMAAMGSTSQRVMAFLCTLEMAKIGLISVRQGTHLGPVVLETVRTPDETDMLLLVGGAQ